MKDYCPYKHYFDEALTKAKEALRKCRQRLNEQAHNGLTNIKK
jgi:hypothetical protein